MSKQLIAYFSASGVTEKVAKRLSKATSADLYAIRPAEPYTAVDLNWRNRKSRSSLEMHDLAFRPALADQEAGIEDYDTVFIGFPIWWHIAPTIINTFMEAYDFRGKSIVLFATSGAEGMGKTLENLQISCPYEVDWKAQKRLSRNVSEEELVEWVKGIV